MKSTFIKVLSYHRHDLVPNEDKVNTVMRKVQSWCSSDLAEEAVMVQQ